ncbi:expressed protein [Batrachochytrium dendrobatidis JAM81]|uniref:Expressed protein n=1 Tax=Batrachochytrium dendrobatidis (strain JAM81 / FGSC 10211) TaxID=684364 RepID=F4PAH2_BATDJ|nr:uncharacterized protein BATDEDRAFT_37364 [Batrachochytrium dendrobatidis JAM81]EGF77685.1 expressed protein [Batrachochytrium dendrobatidis JAM81]|eukprot:XP_006681735.1 expressed protein [Batrachochytrium dendrobatidis JAM81]
MENIFNGSVSVSQGAPLLHMDNELLRQNSNRKKSETRISAAVGRAAGSPETSIRIRSHSSGYISKTFSGIDPSRLSVSNTTTRSIAVSKTHTSSRRITPRE